MLRWEWKDDLYDMTLDKPGIINHEKLILRNVVNKAMNGEVSELSFEEEIMLRDALWQAQEALPLGGMLST